MTSASPGSSPRPEGRPSSGSPPDDRDVAPPDGADLGPEGEPRDLAKTDEIPPPESLDPDQARLDRAKEGDDDAFEEIVRAHQNRVYSKVYYMVHDRGLAEDLAQETFLRVYLGLPSFREECRLSTWIHRIAVNVVLHHFEKASAQKRRGREISIDRSQTGPDERVLEIPDRRNLPDEVAVNRERQRRILAAVAELPDDFRLVLALRELEKQSYQEIGAALDLPMGTVKSKIFRARQILQEKLKEVL